MKIFMSACYLSTKNKKENEMSEWVRNNIDNILLYEDGFSELSEKIKSKADELDRIYPRTKPFRVSAYNDCMLISISVNDFVTLSGKVIKHEIGHE